jgi:hypothetical protein
VMPVRGGRDDTPESLPMQPDAREGTAEPLR